MQAFGIVPFLACFFPYPLPQRILLRDLVGTRFEVVVRYAKGFLCLDAGWHNVGWYYGLRFGGWVQMTFFD